MPIYEYECEGCGQKIEVFQKMGEPPLERCEACQGRLVKLISNCSFQLKGTGWYLTDYKKKGSEEGKGEEKREASKEKSASEDQKT
jgi:putative FmdB family regulatory protein